MQAPWTTTPCRPALNSLRFLNPFKLSKLPWPARPSSSSTRWKQRQGNDVFEREAKVQGLKSRAAFKLLEMDAKYRIFRKGQVVVDLGFAPGSWSQVAVERTKPSGRVVGIDLIPAQPPKGVSAIQGNFLSPHVHALVKQFLVDADARQEGRREVAEERDEDGVYEDNQELEADDQFIDRPSYIDMERQVTQEPTPGRGEGAHTEGRDGDKGRRLVDVRPLLCMRNPSTAILLT